MMSDVERKIQNVQQWTYGYVLIIAENGIETTSCREQSD